MFRWPSITKLPNDVAGFRFIVVMENPLYSIYREDILIPYKQAGDTEFVARVFARAFASIWKNAAAKTPNRGEAAPFKETDLDAVDIEITPHYRVSESANLDMKNLYTRPGRLIGVNGAIESHAIEPLAIEMPPANFPPADENEGKDFA